MGTLTAEPRVINDPAITIGEAQRLLDPPMPRRSLARMLAGLKSVGTVPVEHGGPAAKTYLWSEISKAHVRWVERKFK